MVQTLTRTNGPVTSSATRRGTTEGAAWAATGSASARLIGGLFLLAFVLYGGGNALATSAAGTADVLSAGIAQQAQLALGAFLMVLNAAAVVGLGALIFPILARYGQRTALAYFASRTVEGVFLAIGVLGLLALLPSQYGTGAGGAGVQPAALAPLALQWNAMAYQVAMLSLGLGSVFAWALVFRARLLPRWLPAWGVVGYAIFLAGAIAEIFGLRVGVLLAIPGGLFELALGVWLLLKGFQSGRHG